MNCKRPIYRPLAPVSDKWEMYRRQYARRGLPFPPIKTTLIKTVVKAAVIMIGFMLAAVFLCPVVHAQTFAPQTPQNSPAFVFAAPDTQSGIDPAETASTEAWEALGVTVAALLLFHSRNGDSSGGMNTQAVTPVPEMNTGLTFGLLGALGYTGAAWSWRKNGQKKKN